MVKAITPVGMVEPAAAKCAVAPGILALKNASGPKRHKFTVEVRTKGLKQVTFFLEGRKLKTFTVSTPRRPKFFKLTINTAKLRKGPHHISAVAVLESPACAPVKAAAVFVKPAAGVRRPNFTG